MTTADLDCFLRTDIITDGARMQRIAEALQALGFAPRVPYFLFEKTVAYGGSPHTIAVDLLAPDVGPEHDDLMHRRDPRRIRPRNYRTLHGRRTPEAITIERGTTRVDVSQWGSGVFAAIPHPVSFVLMKLFAFRDRLASDDPAMHADAGYHAFDVFQVIASMNAEEWDEGVAILREVSTHSVLAKARKIVATQFMTSGAPGPVRIATYARERAGVQVSAEQVRRVVGDLVELLADQASTLVVEKLRVLEPPRNRDRSK